MSATYERLAFGPPRRRSVRIALAVALAVVAGSCASNSNAVSLTDPIDTNLLRGTSQLIVSIRVMNQYSEGAGSNPKLWRGIPKTGNFAPSADQVKIARGTAAIDLRSVVANSSTNTVSIVNSAGAELVRIADPLWSGTEYTEIRSEWSPDGSKVLIIRAPWTTTPAREYAAVYSASTGKLLGQTFDGSGYRTVAGQQVWETVTTAWKPDSSSLAYSSGDTVRAMDLAIGSTSRLLSTPGTSVGVCPQVRDWSTEGRLLFLCSNQVSRPNSGSKRLYSTAENGGSVRVLDAGVADLNAPDPNLDARYVPGTNQVMFTRSLLLPLNLTSVWCSNVFAVDDVSTPSIVQVTKVSPTISNGTYLGGWVTLEGFVSS